MNEFHRPEKQQYSIDFRTGYPTAISGDAVSEEIRATCSALNAGRTRGIKEAARFTPSGQQISVDVWSTSFERVASQWKVPLVSLERMGIDCDEDGILSSDTLIALPSGAEASPYLDAEEKVVYKLFDLRIDGSLGKKVAFEENYEGQIELELKDAVLTDTIDKLSVLNDTGAHLTEVVGLSDDGCYLIAKQPLAYAMNSFIEDRDVSLKLIRAVVPKGGHYRSTVAIIWLNEEAWIISDLHDRNIMIDSNGKPTIIDALIGGIPPQAIRSCYFLDMAISDARQWKITGQLPLHTPFEDVADEEL